MSNTIQVTCEGMDSFHDVIEALNGRFNPDVNIKLTISYSKLMVSVRSVIFTILQSREYLTDPSSSPIHDHPFQDMEHRSFSEMNMNVKHLRMNYDNFG